MTLSAIHKAFEQIVRQYPDQIAVQSNQNQISYADLNLKANQLAHTLIRLGVTANTPVAFVLDHDLPAIIAMLGILKANGAYVPIDPSNPVARISHILKDIDTWTIVTNNTNAPLIHALAEDFAKLTVINLDHLDASNPIHNPDLPSDPHHYAYLLFTSGSTGLPKGAIHSHQDVIQNARHNLKIFSLSSKDRVALYISFGFEASRFAIYAALLFGGRLCLYDIHTYGVQELSQWIDKEQISIILSTPSTFRYMLKLAEKSRQYPHIRAINLGGEIVNKNDVDLFRQHFPKKAVLVNTLGMTEIGIVARYRVDQHTHVSSNSLPSGYAIGEKKLNFG